MKTIVASLLMTQTMYILVKRIKGFFFSFRGVCVCVGGYAIQCGDHLVYHNLKT